MFIRCNITPPPVETILWTNPSPNSAFGTKNVTLNDDIQNYTYIKVTIGYSKNNLQKKSSSIMLVSDFINQKEETGNIPLYIGARDSANEIKAVFYVSNTEVRIVHIVRTNSNTSITIPLYIIGVK